MKSCHAKKRWSAADSVKLAVRSTFPVKNGSSFYYSIKISTQKGTDCVINMQKAEAGETDEGERRQARGMSQCFPDSFRFHAMWAWGLQTGTIFLASRSVWIWMWLILIHLSGHIFTDLQGTQGHGEFDRLLAAPQKPPPFYRFHWFECLAVSETETSTLCLRVL